MMYVQLVSHSGRARWVVGPFVDVDAATAWAEANSSPPGPEPFSLGDLGDVGALPYVDLEASVLPEPKADES